MLLQLPECGAHLAQVGSSVGEGRCSHSDEDDPRAAHRIGNVIGDRQPSVIHDRGQELLEAALVNRRDASSQLIEALRGLLDDADVPTGFSQPCGRD